MNFSTSSNTWPFTVIAPLFLAFVRITLHLSTLTPRSDLAAFVTSLLAFNWHCLCVDEINATSSAKSRSSSLDVKFQVSPVSSSFTVCLIIQSVISRKRKPDIAQPCLTPFAILNNSEVASLSKTAHSKPSYSALIMLVIFILLQYYS